MKRESTKVCYFLLVTAALAVFLLTFGACSKQSQQTSTTEGEGAKAPAAEASKEAAEAPKETPTEAPAEAAKEEAPEAAKAPERTTPATVNRAKLMNPSANTEKAPDTYQVKFATTKGDFVITVTKALAPLGADRFYNLVKIGYYNNAKFFRVVPGFVVQFGLAADPKVTQTWQNTNLKDDPVKGTNKKGTITFATAGPNTRTTQVFINLGNNGMLDSQGFAPFGEVTEGMDVVEQLFSGYGESVTNLQGQIALKGNVFLNQSFPNLDSIKTATIM